ncbi:hypothetical protein AMAG_13225 [Allomyces macrogynus ATCC 38327]|uniref:Uncharacterized protein n=1 Tax=Allomyces macrogynus (strain ATCC 38327) TaxID=578462 RepID=A0A0L0SZY0_ALLM3|nr:hypothetical protein AMAG_13225 [Allomyces macrogynus ATCC 38327]|eukprot:KNE68052.1 hypothetical protein AMAG_13225 [Allomyces macrogynus ATCC 38327]
MDPPGWTSRSNDWCGIDPVFSVPAVAPEPSSTQHAVPRSREHASACSGTVRCTDNDDAVLTRMLAAMRTVLAHISALRRAPDTPGTTERLADLELLAATCLRYLLLQRGDRAATTPSSRTSSLWDAIPGFGDADAAARDLDELCEVPASAIKQGLSPNHAQVLDSVCRELAAVVSALGSPTAPTSAAPVTKDRAWSARTRDQPLFSPPGSVHDEDGPRVVSADDAKDIHSLAGLFDSPGSTYGSDGGGIPPLASPAEPAQPAVPQSCFSDLWQGAVRSTTGNARPLVSSSWDQIDGDVEDRLFGTATTRERGGDNLRDFSASGPPATTTATRNDPGDSLFPDPGTTTAAPVPLPSAAGMPMAPPVTAAAAPSSRPSDHVLPAQLNALKADMAQLVREWTHLSEDRDAARKVVDSVLGTDPSVRKIDKLDWAKLERHVYQYGDDHPDGGRLVVWECANAIVHAVAKAPTFGKAAAHLATRVVNKGPAGLAAAVVTVLAQVEPSLERLFGTGATNNLPSFTGDKAQANLVAFWALLMVYPPARTPLPVSGAVAVYHWLDRAIADPRGTSPVAITWAVLLGGDTLFRWDRARTGALIQAARAAVQSCSPADREAVLDASFGVIDLVDPLAALEAPPRTELYKIKRDTGQSVSAQLAALPVAPWPILCRKDTWPVSNVRDVAVQPSKSTTKVQDLYESMVEQWEERRHVAWSSKTETVVRGFLKAHVDTVAPSFMWLRRAITAGCELIKEILDAEDGGDDDDPSAQVWFVGRVVAGKMARMLVSTTADDPRFEYLAQLLTAMMIFNGEFRHGALTHFLDQVPQLAGVTLSMRIQPLQSPGSAKTAHSRPDTAANVRLWAHVATTVPFFTETNQYFGTPLTFLFKSFDRSGAMQDVIATALESPRVHAIMDRFGEMCAFQYELAQLARNAPGMARFLAPALTPSIAAPPVPDAPSVAHSSGTGLILGLGLGLTSGWPSRPISSEWPRATAGSSSSWSRADTAGPSNTGPSAAPLVSWTDDPAPTTDPTPSSPWTPTRRTDSASAWSAPAPAVDLMSMEDAPEASAWSSPVAAPARFPMAPPPQTLPASRPAVPVRVSPTSPAATATARDGDAMAVQQARSQFIVRFDRQLQALRSSRPSQQDLRKFADGYSQETAKVPLQLARHNWERIMASVAVKAILDAVKRARTKEERLMLAELALLLARRDALVSGILKGELERCAPELVPPPAGCGVGVEREVKRGEMIERARFIGFYAMMARDAQENNPFPFADLVSWVEHTLASPNPTAQSNLYLAVVLPLVGEIFVDSARGTTVTGRPSARPTVDQDRARALILALQTRVAETRVDPTDEIGVEACKHLIAACRRMRIVS